MQRIRKNDGKEHQKEEGVLKKHWKMIEDPMSMRCHGPKYLRDKANDTLEAGNSWNGNAWGVNFSEGKDLWWPKETLKMSQFNSQTLWSISLE